MKKKVTMDDIRQLHFFDDCEDIVFDIRHGDGTIQKALADFDEQDIEQVTQQKTNNIRAAETEAELWERSIKLIIPLLRDNPGWVWRDAVNELAASGLV
jgi:regulatory protein YycH of two-component signal transduction system YycFG